jgi:hypothetical protein
VKTKSENKLWTCPKCGRQFARTGQSHSCKPFALEQHFEGKESSKPLYNKFKKAVKENTGPFKVESLECCIHFVKTSTFLAVKIMKNKIRVDFSLDHKIKSKRIVKSLQMSANRFLYVIDIADENQINKELLEWISESRDKKKVKQ